MIIKRRNILELIGKHSGKYHSCIITCYSFDFSFFEERVLPLLRQANIKNVNVLCDGHYLEKAQEETTGKEFKHNKTYNFQPIYESGVFHPKIVLLTGQRHGLLFIGSGNITSSGLSTNDEIWGAFHLDNLGNENAPLFGAIWNYLSPYLNQSLGFIPQKVEWIRKYSPWLSELPLSVDWINLESLNLQVKFIANSSKSSTFKELVSSVPKDNLLELVIISPYYDKDGIQIKQLKEYFSPKSMRCIIDHSSGLVPYNLDPNIASQISFHNWFECKDDYEEGYNRLHAKLCHFKFIDEEYLLLGSANITLAGMGFLSEMAANGEAGILLRRTRMDNDWMQDLKINYPKNSIQISKSQNSGIGEGTIKKSYLEYKLLYSELRANEITVYLNKEFRNQIRASVLDRFENSVENHIKEFKENIVVIKVTNPDQVFKVTLFEGENRIANYSIIHRLEALLRCNPDPNQEKLDTLLEQDFSDGEGITDLLQFVDYNWADEDNSQINKSFVTKISNISNSNSENQAKEYEVLCSDEFNKVSAEMLLRQSGELSNATVKIAEFLTLYSSGLGGTEEEFNESEEQKLFEDENQIGEGNEVDITKRKRAQGSKEKLALQKYFHKLNHLYDLKLQRFIKSEVIRELPDEAITIRLLSSVLIAMHLIQLKYGKKFTVLTKDVNEFGEFVTKEESYIGFGNLGNDVGTLKGFLLNAYAKFLLISNVGIKQYDFQILNQKIKQNRNQLFLKSTILILNTPWRESELFYMNLLLLNNMNFGLDETFNESEIISSLEKMVMKNGYLIPEFHSQFEYFIIQLFPSYLKWHAKFIDKEVGRKQLFKETALLNYGNILFNSKIGFNMVIDVQRSNGVFYLNLMRPGYSYNDSSFNLRNIPFVDKCILFS